MRFYVADNEFVVEYERPAREYECLEEGSEHLKKDYVKLREGDLVQLDLKAVYEFTNGTPAYDLFFFERPEGSGNIYNLYRADGSLFATEHEEVYIEKICPEYITLVNQNLPFDVNILLSLDEAAVTLFPDLFWFKNAKNTANGVKTCHVCDNARINPELTDEDDFASFDIGKCMKGFRTMVSSGYGKPLRIEFEKWDEGAGRWVEVGRYYPKCCPNCGREITEYNTDETSETSADAERSYIEYAVEVYDEKGFNRQLDVFSTQEEAEKYIESCDENLTENEYFNITYIKYDKNDNEIDTGTVL